PIDLRMWGEAIGHRAAVRNACGKRGADVRPDLTGTRRVAAAVIVSWSAKFDEPIPLPEGRQLVTLKDAADYITGLPKKESDLPEWQAAIEALMLVLRGGPTMFARIGVMQALNRCHVREFDQSRKEHHWGRRKLKRDQ